MWLELHKLVSELGKLLSYFWWYGEVVQVLYELEKEKKRILLCNYKSFNISCFDLELAETHSHEE